MAVRISTMNTDGKAWVRAFRGGNVFITRNEAEAMEIHDRIPEALAYAKRRWPNRTWTLEELQPNNA